ncbi:MAG: hypothetical protein LHV68_09960 [Elusimicrobia bacterium]|nr:hypothetical protein [Candidatus Liberimonas magnetica]
MQAKVLGELKDFKNVQDFQDYCRDLIKKKEQRRIELKNEDKTLKKEIKELKGDIGDESREETTTEEK